MSPSPGRPAHSTMSHPHEMNSHSRPWGLPSPATGHTSSEEICSCHPTRNQLCREHRAQKVMRAWWGGLTDHGGSSGKASSGAMVEVISSSGTIERQLHVSVSVYTTWRRARGRSSWPHTSSNSPGMTSFPVASTILASLGTSCKSLPTFLQRREDRDSCH